MRVLFISLLVGVWAALLFLLYVMRSVDNTRVEERKKQERKAREDHRRAVVAEFLERKKELEEQKALEHEEAVEEAKRKMSEKRLLEGNQPVGDAG